ncbi:MAG: secretin N-terminal domain-containing protein [Cellvibrio sp.]|uniref:secretin N-terminal domain-containing protein n=1 Tax=Cellvibrio sp. TaxID=1965322 RepID=UPI0031B16FF6
MIRKSVYSVVSTSLLVLVLSSITSCTLIPDSEMAPPKPLVVPPAKQKSAQDDEVTQRRDEKENRFTSGPVANPGNANVKAMENVALFPADESPEISLSIDALPLPSFINEVFANELKLDFQMAPDVANKEDLVTLRVTDPRNRQEIFELGRQVLASYGVLIIQQGDLLKFVLGGGKNSPFEPPLIVTGNALPSVPATHRPIFLVRTLNVVSANDAANMLQTVFQGQSLKINQDGRRNAVTLNGSPDLVQSAADVLTMLDRPNMKGRYSLRVDPLYTDADTLSRSMQATMSAQGYDVGGVTNNITLVPIKELNALFAFAPDSSSLSLVRQWAEQLDKVAIRSNHKDGFYWYKVRNTSAAELASTLNAAMNGGSSNSTLPNNDATATSRQSQSQTRTPGGASTRAVGGQGGAVVSGAFVVDQARNMLLFRGEADRWQEMLPLIRELDQAPTQVLVEVIVAEITLTDEFKFGMEWALKEVSAGGAKGELKSVFGEDGVPGSGVGGTGLVWSSLSNSGMTRLALNAFASNNNVSILQTPKILVRSGQSASVSVGQQIPLLVSQTVTDEQVDGDTGTRQSVEYRDTGISLTVIPTVYSDGRIDLDIQQEVSGASVDQSKVNLTPIVSSRSINTSLSLRDGGSVLLGGLITKEQTKGNSRIPVLGSLPVLGHLFRTDSTSAGTTELMMLVVPYLVREPEQAEALTKSFREQLHIPQ